MQHKIGVGYASVTEIEKKYVLDALERQRLSQGKYVAAFEKRFANLHGHRYGVMCSSGTSALHLAMAALREADGWTNETEILVPAITFIATSKPLTKGWNFKALNFSNGIFPPNIFLPH